MNKILIAIAISAAFVAIPASAQPYVGGGFGAAKTDANHTSYKLFAGIQATQNFGAEIAYNDLGSYSGAKITTWSVAMTGTLPMDKNWDIFGKLGATENRTTLPGSSRKSDLLAGLGVGYNFNQNVAVRFEYEDFGKLPTNGFGFRSRASNWGLNAKYTF